MELLSRSPFWITIVVIGTMHFTEPATEIPEFLSECYEINWAVTNQYQQLPMTMPVLIDIIRILEDHPGAPKNIEDMALILFNIFRLDGVKKNSDFSINSIDLQYDRQMLIKRMFEEQPYNQLNISLPMELKCHLHFMLSNAVNDDVRGDEDVTCSRQYGYPNESNEDSSQCPVESGVISTEFGPIAAGIVITGIAAGLQSKEKTMENDIRIEWAATLAGHLATGPLFQLTSPVINVSRTFDDLFFPLYYYINDNQNLYLSEAGINGAIDGLILAINIGDWRKRFKGIKLSQLLEMYYTRRGVFNTTICAGNRHKLFTEILQKYQDNSHPFGEVLFQQVLSTSLAIESQIMGAHMKKEAIIYLSRQTVNVFLDFFKD